MEGEQSKGYVHFSLPPHLFAIFLVNHIFPGGLEVKASASNAGDPGSILGSGRFPGEGNGNPPGESHGQRSLVGYSPRGCKESDTTEQLHLLTYLVNHYCLIREMMEFRFHLQGTERL